MQNGPKVNFTTSEMERFNELCSKWKEIKNHTQKTFPEWSAGELGGQRSSEYLKFVSYLRTVQAVNQSSQAREKVQSAQQEYVQATSHLRALQEHKESLEKQIQSDTQRIQSSREQTAKRIADGIKIGLGKRQN